MALQAHAFLLPLVESGKYSDFTLLCKGHEFKLHQVIVCPQSPVLAAALSGCFQESTSKIITVNEFDLSTVQSMISFLYTGEYQLNSKERESSTTDDKQHQDQDETSSIISESVMDDTTEKLLCHVRINTIADYYNIEALAQLANSKVQTIFEANKDAKVLPPVIQEISTSNRDAQLRSIVASATAKRMEELTDLKAFQDVEFEHTLCIETLWACGKRIHLLQHDLDVIESQAVMFESAHEQLTKDMGKCMDLLKETHACRHCSKGFGCYFEESDLGESSYMLRCRACRCRHS